VGQPRGVPAERPALSEDEPFVGVDGQVIPQHVANLVEADPGAELAGVEQVTAEHRHMPTRQAQP
jgi:hypothetical protein